MRTLHLSHACPVRLDTPFFLALALWLLLPCGWS